MVADNYTSIFQCLNSPSPSHGDRYCLSWFALRIPSRGHSTPQSYKPVLSFSFVVIVLFVFFWFCFFRATIPPLSSGSQAVLVRSSSVRHLSWKQGTNALSWRDGLQRYNFFFTPPNFLTLFSEFLEFLCKMHSLFVLFLAKYHFYLPSYHAVTISPVSRAILHLLQPLTLSFCHHPFFLFFSPIYRQLIVCLSSAHPLLFGSQPTQPCRKGMAHQFLLLAADVQTGGLLLPMVDHCAKLFQLTFCLLWR